MTIDIDLTGRVCLVVGGAGGGIGTAAALAAAQAGAGVAIITNLQQHADDVVEQLGQLGARSGVVIADVTDEDSLVQAIARLGAELGAIQHLINVVGGNLAGDYHPAAEFDMVAFDRVVARNLRYAVVACREVARPLLAAGSPGSIVNISSVAARGAPLLGAYAAAKAGLEAFSRTMALEWGPSGIRVNVVTVGTVHTPRTGRTNAAATADFIPLRRRGEPSEVAAAAVFLLSDLASYSTGHTLNVDGGIALGSPGGTQLSPFVTRSDVLSRFSS